ASWMIRRGMITPIYIYRDPRDALLSAFEYGKRKRESGRSGPFSDLMTIDMAIDFMREYIRISDSWLACEQALHARYEDLLLDYDTQAERLVGFLDLDQHDLGVKTVLDQYRPSQGSSQGKGTHFVKGKIGRYRDMLNSEQQARCVDDFGPYLERMNYPIP
ncbi:MAG: sulfotransferase domain-containing protein, partial [Chloroflexota bacterium]